MFRLACLLAAATLTAARPDSGYGAPEPAYEEPAEPVYAAPAEPAAEYSAPAYAAPETIGPVQHCHNSLQCNVMQCMG